MGLFTGFTSKSTGSSSTASFSGSRHLSSHELDHEVRRDLHDRLGEHKGEQAFQVLSAHRDKDNGHSGANGREIKGTLAMLEKNHRDNFHSDDIAHIREVLLKHYND